MAEVDLEAQLRRTDPDRWMSSRFIGDADKRADVVAIYAFDGELARAPQASSNPIVCEMRLAWWREVLEEIFESRPVRRHPIAEALAEVVRRRGLPREPLEAMVDARYRELEPQVMTPDEALGWAQGTGGQAAKAAASLLDPSGNGELAEAAGGAWMLSRRVAGQPDLAPVLADLLRQARADARRLSPEAFPAVAHATLVGATGGSEFGRRLRVTWAVMRGRI